MEDHGTGSRKSLRRSQAFVNLAPTNSPPLLRTSRSMGSFSPAVSSRESPDIRASGTNALSDSNRTTGQPASLDGSANQKQMMDASDDPAQDKANSAPKKPVDELADRIRELRHEMGQQCADRAIHAVRETTAGIKDRRLHSGKDLFSNSRPTIVSSDHAGSMKIKFKQHLRHKKDSPQESHVPIPIKSSKERVPRYKFHHIEIEKNIITPRSMHTFVPHLRDVDEAKEMEYEAWVQELEDTDKKLGFTTLSPEQKRILTMQSERAALLSLYLEDWLERLAIPGCSMTSLLRLAGPEDSDDEDGNENTTPMEGVSTEDGTAATELFIEAFRKVFTNGPLERRVELAQVLRYCKSSDNVMEPKPTARDDLADEFEDEDEQTEAVLGSYSILGCQICHQQSCEHGDYDANDLKQYFTAKLPDLLKRRRMARGDKPFQPDRDLSLPCEHEQSKLAHCPPHGMSVQSTPWTDKQRAVLRSIWANLLELDDFEDNPKCEIASWLNRPCREVRYELRKMNITLPPPPPPSTQPVKALSWYDRYKKALYGNWQDHLKVHAYNKRETGDPCSHEGPCMKGTCPCVDKGLLCEKFCGCTLECCAYKFNGCACHARGKNCMSKQKDKPCICVQLDRECDPSLCGSCGIKEDTAPRFLDDENSLPLRRRCKNSDLQHGREKAVVVGRSQLQSVGYGLYTAEPISQDEFVLEYRGEIITQDEGTRRAARRGSDEPSFSFTLLDTEGVWIDAAMYGNLSRYINHAPEKDKWGCNIMPKIVYVNGEFRIKFIAMRNIAVGEELFFNYGDNFPNLTEKLLNDTPVVSKTTRRKSRVQSDDSESKRGPGRPRKFPSPVSKPLRSARLRDSQGDLFQDDDSDMDESSMPRPTRKRKRGATESGNDDYGPAHSKPDSSDVEGGEEGRTQVGDSPATTARLRAARKQRRLARNAGPAPPVKPKGKRGGARPGSGRPRKHPLPVPKDQQPTGKAPPSAASAAKESSTPVTRKKTPEPVLPRLSTRSATNSTPLKSSLPAVPDSEDYSAVDGDADDMSSDDGRGTRRAMRKRRPPMKFTGEDVWRASSLSA
ncbi:hypothetical protein NLU13_8175 [Sarocladium strictum]|uniref:Uncharacterized protein n=1 Tax=Sarocladium strictum TaxID=5046 RepID=A0AA39GBN0_SARSR|nr:hypothetical protein NLU13_8175 [Sarocladium strictum]